MDVVRIHPFQLNKKTWDKAMVKRRLDVRFYEVESNDTLYRRNRVDLKQTQETPITKEATALTETSELAQMPVPTEMSLEAPSVAATPVEPDPLARLSRIRREPV